MHILEQRANVGLSSLAAVLIDLAINPFGADVDDMVRMARAAEDLGYRAVWVADHFSGAVVGRPWSRDPFVCLAAIAVQTSAIELGPLVANMQNRHPAQLASAVNSLQSLAPGRVRVGVGSGAVPGSRFAVEHDAIGRDLGTADHRRAKLRESVRSLRAIWTHDPTFTAETGVGFERLSAVVDDAPCPPIIVGASAWPTIELALEEADGVNLRRTALVGDLIDRIEQRRPEHFEVSMLDGFDDMIADPSRIGAASEMGLDRLILGISVPHEVARLSDLNAAAFHLD